MPKEYTLTDRIEAKMGFGEPFIGEFEINGQNYEKARMNAQRDERATRQPPVVTSREILH